MDKLHLVYYIRYLWVQSTNDPNTIFEKKRLQRQSIRLPAISIKKHIAAFFDEQNLKKKAKMDDRKIFSKINRFQKNTKVLIKKMLFREKACGYEKFIYPCIISEAS